MARTTAHRPYKQIPPEEERPEGYDAQKHTGRRPRAAVLARGHNRRARHKARTDITAGRFDDLAPAGSGRHSGVYAAY